MSVKELDAEAPVNGKPVTVSLKVQGVLEKYGISFPPGTTVKQILLDQDAERYVEPLRKGEWTLRVGGQTLIGDKALSFAPADGNVVFIVRNVSGGSRSF